MQHRAFSRTSLLILMTSTRISALLMTSTRMSALTPLVEGMELGPCGRIGFFIEWAQDIESQCFKGGWRTEYRQLLGEAGIFLEEAHRRFPKTPILPVGHAHVDHDTLPCGWSVVRAWLLSVDVVVFCGGFRVCACVLQLCVVLVLVFGWSTYGYPDCSFFLAGDDNLFPMFVVFQHRMDTLLGFLHLERTSRVAFFGTFCCFSVGR